jgi:bifunctional non-homologous end joining protein LigD
MAEKLETYYAKRDFSKTPEPRGAVPTNASGRLSYIIQKHAATRLHYDFRLELDGVMLSWAVPKGPSLDPSDKRLAMQTEDHPMEYSEFEGVIPKGQYGGGTVLLWDRGAWEPVGDPHAGYAKGHLRFRLDGEKLHGEWNLVRIHGSSKYGKDDEGKAWLLMKVDDADAVRDDDVAIVDREPGSVKSGRTLEEIAADKDRVWHSTKSVAENVAAGAVAQLEPQRAKRASRAKKAADGDAETARPAKARRNGKADVSPPPSQKAARQVARSRAPAKARTADATKTSLADLPGAKKSPLPRELAPMLCTLVDEAPSGEGWVHEIKYDGYRMLARIDHGDVEISSRNGKVWTGVLGAIAKALGRLPVETAWIDGEVVVMDARGHTSFNALQNALGGSDADLTYIAFDVMHLDGYDLTRVPLTTRKQVLKALLDAADEEGPLRFGPEVEGNGPDFFGQACALGLEGIISKRADAPYRLGVRNREWLKIKCQQRQEMVIGGYTEPQGSRRGFGALLIGVYDNGKLRYAGKVGTGFNSETLASIYRQLVAREQDKPSFVNPPRGYEAKGAHWVKPDLVCEVTFTEWSPEGALRHPSFQGMRVDKRATEVRRERPAPVAQAANDARDGADTDAGAEDEAPVSRSATKRVARRASSAAEGETTKPATRAAKKPAPGATIVAGVSLSNPDKLYFPEIGFSKADLARYYDAVSKWMIPYIAHRPLSLVRCPEGWQGQCFYQKNADRAVHPAVERVEVPESKGTATYMAASDATGLVALAQWGCIEIHPWGSRTPKLLNPDILIMDFDPDDGLPWQTLVEAVNLLRTLLDDLKLRGFLKTTGGKGLHVVLPIKPTLSWDDAKGFTGAVATLLVKALPDRFTSVMSKERRKGKIFVDYLRNGLGATAIAPYAVRARKNAPVAMPIEWDELARDVRFDHFNATNALARLQKQASDPWADFVKVRQTITRAMFDRVDFRPRR